MTWSDLGNARFTFERGLHDLGNGAYAWLQPDGGWGWSNAGLVVDGDQSLLIDTLFDLPLTREMLDAMKDAVPAARTFDTLINTHANGDHCHGNELVVGAEIIASNAAAKEMEELPPERLAMLMKSVASQPTMAGEFLTDCFGAFDFEGIHATLPTRTFDGHLSIQVGDKAVELHEVGPAHTRGDILVHVPSDRTVFTGDILFIEGTPIMWVGPVQNWLDACDRILEMDVETVVPGHGPITDRRGPRAVKAYLEYVRDEARRRYDAGLDAFEAARDIALSDFSSWGDAERIVINVDTLYREFSGSSERTDTVTLFSRMAEVARR